MNGARNSFPTGWDESRVQAVIAHYDAQTEDEAAFEDTSHTVMVIPNEIVPAVRALIPESADPEPATADRQ